MGNDQQSMRRYTEAEIQEILRLSVQVQERALPRKAQREPPARQKDGMTLPEIQEAATELGLDPRHVALAAQRVQFGREKQPFNALGAPLTWEAECCVPGRLTEEDWHQIVAQIRRIARHRGTVENLGTSWEWRRDGDTDGVRIAPHGADTQVRLWLRNGALAAVTYYLGLCAGGLAGIATAEWLDLSLPGALATLAGTLGASVCAARQIVSASFSRRKRCLREIVEAIEEHAIGDGQMPEVDLSTPRCDGR